MPSKDPEKRRQVAREWRKRKHTPNYMRWLGARRALSRELVAIYETALTQIAGKGHAGYTDQEIAVEAIEQADHARRALGNRFDHETDEPYWKET